MSPVLESDFTLLPADAKNDRAYRRFVEEMKGRAYGREALNDAWLWFKKGFEHGLREGSWSAG